MEKNHKIILTRLVEGMLDVFVGDIDLVALVAHEAESILMSLERADGLLTCKAGFDIYIL